MPGERTFNYPSRTLNEEFENGVFDINVSYGVDITSELSLTSGEVGEVILEYANDDAFTEQVKTVCKGKNGNTGALALGLGLTDTKTVTLTGIIPAGKWIRLRTNNITGSPSYAIVSAQEVDDAQ